MKRTIGYLRNRTSTVLTFIVATFFCLLLSGIHLLKQYTPRRYCMFGEVYLISSHLISDIVASLSYFSMSIGLYVIYRNFKEKQLPWKGFIWMFSVFIFLCGCTHLIGAINLFVTYYWIDAIFKIMNALFSAAVALEFFRCFPQIKGLRPPVEYLLLAEKLKELQKDYELLKNSQDSHDNP